MSETLRVENEQSPTRTQSGELAAVQVVRKVLNMVACGELKLGCRVSGLPYVEFCSQGQQAVRSLNSRTISSWLAKLYFETANVTATKGELEGIARTLEGYAREATLCSRDCGHDDLPDDEPVVAAVLDYFRGEVLTKLASELWRELTNLAKNTLRHSSKWPASPSVMSRVLKQHVETLQHHGVSLHFRHHHEGTRITLSPWSTGSEFPADEDHEVCNVVIEAVPEVARLFPGIFVKSKREQTGDSQNVPTS